MADITLWVPREAVTIPASIKEPNEIAGYARQLTKREKEQVLKAFEAGNYEMGALFLWSKTMAGLKKQLSSLGMDFIGQMLDRSDITTDSPPHVLTDHDVVKLAEQLGMFGPTQAMRLRQVLEIIAHFAESESDDEDDGDKEMMPEEAVRCMRTCIQSVLGHEKLEGAVKFAEFRANIEEKSFSADDTEIQSLQSSPYFFRRTTLRVLLSLAKTAHGAQLEHTLANTYIIVPLLWPQLLKSDRWLIGRAYSDLHNDGKKTAASGLRKVLLKVRGFDYVPEDLRMRTFISAAIELQNAHFGYNNYYNEPPAIRTLHSLGSTIPLSALSHCMSALLCVRLGKPWGFAFGSQDTAKEILSELNESRWKYYLEECLPADEAILEKLMNKDLAERWCTTIVQKHDLSEIEIKDSRISRLLKASNNKLVSKVVDLAGQLQTEFTRAQSVNEGD
jgi:hypothetical protein